MGSSSSNSSSLNSSSLNSSSSKSFNGNNSMCSKIANFKKHNLKKIIKAAIIITPLDQRQKTVRGLLAAGSLLVFTAVTLPISVGVGPLIALAISSEVTLLSAGVAKKLMFHYKLWFQVQGGVEIIIQFGQQGLNIQATSGQFDHYRPRNSLDNHVYRQADYFHIQKGDKDVLKTIELNENVVWGDVQKVVKQNESKRYDVASWNCKDYALAILNVIQKKKK